MSAVSVPTRPDAAGLVLAVADDPRSGAQDLARAISCDPALTSRTLALANSAYYGLSGRVGTTTFAVSVVGFDTVRALALTLAAGLDRPDAVPAGFWQQAATAAAAASVCAPMFAASAPDAFVAGLLHTIGAALLHQRRPLPALCLPFAADGAALVRRERELYGTTHAELADRTLREWHFPDPLCELIAGHHDESLPNSPPLTRVLHTARLITDRLLVDGPVSPAFEATLLRVSEGRFAPEQVDAVLAGTRARAAALHQGLVAG